MATTDEEVNELVKREYEHGFVTEIESDTGTKMIHLGKNTSSTIIAKGISASNSSNAYRGLVKFGPGAEGARNFTQCDSLLIGDRCGAHTFPYIESKINRASSSMKPRPPRSATSKCSFVASAESTLNRPFR